MTFFSGFFFCFQSDQPTHYQEMHLMVNGEKKRDGLMSQRMFQVLEENGLNSKLKHKKTQKLILFRIFGDLYGRLGDWCYILESP